MRLICNVAFRYKRPPVNAGFTEARQIDRRVEGRARDHVGAPRNLRDRADGGQRRRCGFPYSGHAPSPYPPL